MIVPMAKVYLAARLADRSRLVDQLGELGVVHLAPVDPAKALPDEQAITTIAQIERALQVLAPLEVRGVAPKISAMDAAQEVLELQRRQAERLAQLASLHRQMEQVSKVWGDLALSQLADLREAGVDVHFFTIPKLMVRLIDAECVQEIGTPHAHHSLLAVIERRRTLHMPAEAQPLVLPSKDAPSIRAEAAAIDAAIQHDQVRLTELAAASTAMKLELHRLRHEAAHVCALRGGVSSEELFALQGWIPADRMGRLAPSLEAAGVEFALHTQPPTDDDNPPTLVQCPKWAEPIQGLFGILGTVPGYREFDVSIPFIIALPIFAAILIGDGGYGTLLLLVPAIFYPRISSVMGRPLTLLIMIIGAASLIWGILIGSFFGMTPPFYRPLLPVDMTEQSRTLMMTLSFVLGTIHLCVAKLWRALVAYPNLSFLAELGWAVWFWGMFGAVRMFVLQTPFNWGTPYPYLLIVGGTLAILFNSPRKNVFTMVLLGVANFPLAMLGTFGDVISYVRLMAVGLASGVLAVSFNQLVWQSGFLPLAVLIFACAHMLNIGLCMIALFSHGVRLNILEFSNNLGMTWSGYNYNPFVRKRIQEIC